MDRVRRMGLLSELAMRQEDYRSLIEGMLASTDHSYAESIAIPPDLDTEVIISISTVLFELKHRDPDAANEAILEDVLWASEFIDHLDTLGWEVRRKPDAHR
jgi:hypothetical protein